jgi:hypothetical protein
MTTSEVEEKIREYFEDNYELLALESGHTVTEDVKRLALQQVLFYYKKMRHVAERVTDTEVRLTLPNQKTAKGRTFTIEGIVDIVREGDETWMYDIKTHDPEFVQANRAFYEKQLNVYGYIWQGLRGQPLDHTAVISTDFPPDLKDAMRENDAFRINEAVERWNPEINIPYHPEHVEETIRDFANTVDCIENHEFAPPPPERLEEKLAGSNSRFGRRICRRCDARFSCNSFRAYIFKGGTALQSDYQKFITDLADDADQEDWINANLQSPNFGNRND